MFWDTIAGCKPGGQIIIPTYINREKGKGEESGIAKLIGKAGADFKRQFTYDSYRQFFADAGYKNVSYKMIDGRMPCAVAVISKQTIRSKQSSDRPPMLPVFQGPFQSEHP